MKTSHVSWPVLAVVLLGLLWSGHYVWSTATNPMDSAEAAWLIKPLLLALAIVSPFVVWSGLGPQKVRVAIDPGESLWYQTRTIYVISLPFLAGAIWWLGFIVATVIYMPAVALALGERRPAVITIATGLLVALIWFGFHLGLDIRLPLWPRGMNG